jgi:ABC-type antimicrobial peptide transport system permease subunit
MIVGRGMALTGLGLLVGLTLAWIASRAVATLLYGVVATDAATFGGVIALLAAVAAVACTLPALRATRVDPMAVLRDE